MDGNPRPEAAGASLRLAGVCKRYGKGASATTVFDGIDLDVKAGEFVAIMGPSGSGKTTLLNLMAGLDRPDAGEVRVAGTTISALGAPELERWRARNIGLVFQFYNLMPTMTALQNVELPLLLTHLPAAQRRRNAELALALVGMSDRGGHRPDQLSGGQQQRVAIARAIVADPDILVCDEPTGDLDRESADQVLQLLRLLNSQHDKTVVMVTHDPRAAQHASRIIRVDKGAIAGAPQAGAALA